MRTIAESFGSEDARHVVLLARALVDAGRGLTSAVVDEARRVAGTPEGRKALRAQNPPRELIAALERGGVRL